MNSGTFGTSLRQGCDREQSGYYTSTSRQQNAPVGSNSSYSELYWTGGTHRESYAPAGLASNTSSWSSIAFPDPSSVWPGDQRLDNLPLGSIFGAPEGNAHASGMDLMGMEVAASVSEQAFPVAPRALPAFRPYPPPFTNWPQAPGPSWQPTSSWDHPAHIVGQHSDHSNSIGSLAMRPVFQSPNSSVITRLSERRLMPASPVPSITTPNSVRPSTLSNPVPVASSEPRSRGERWSLSNETTFHCMWTSWCAALVAGDRRSVTNHLRDGHNFACDGKVIACAWGDVPSTAA
ncbi:hypothetical protein J3R82DRAFT_10459 [Butyriboletus roseoflavus]|nr:hypothetical protein J3R82DRAFT_10459 [Butyriboletus roseoflavus]